MVCWKSSLQSTCHGASSHPAQLSHTWRRADMFAQPLYDCFTIHMLNWRKGEALTRGNAKEIVNFQKKQALVRSSNIQWVVSTYIHKTGCAEFHNHLATFDPCHHRVHTVAEEFSPSPAARQCLVMKSLNYQRGCTFCSCSADSAQWRAAWGVKTEWRCWGSSGSGGGGFFGLTVCSWDTYPATLSPCCLYLYFGITWGRQAESRDGRFSLSYLESVGRIWPQVFFQG